MLTYMGCGRGGEVKFINTTDWTYHPPIGCTDIVWTELKTVSKQAMPMFSNKDCWLVTYHCAGAYFAVEDGLYRSTNQDGIETFLFPNLHNMQNNSVAGKITAII